MVDSRLINYIKQQLMAGYDIQTVRTFLLNNGYPQQDVDAAIQYVQPQQQRPQKQPSQEKMLISYVKQYLKQGYQPQQIEQSLLQRGYPQFTIKQVMKKATKKPFSLPQFHPSKQTLLIVVLLILIIISVMGIAWFFMNTEFSSDQEVDFDVSIDVTTVAPGDTLYITNDFIDFPDEREYPITIYYTINDKETLTRVDSWQQAIDRTDALVRSEKHGLARTIEAGDYELNVKMSYGTQSVQAYAYFRVSADEDELDEAELVAVEQEEQEKEEQQAEDMGETETTDDTQDTDDTSETEVVESTSEWSVVSSDDYTNYATAKELAATDAEAAAQYCEAINDSTKKDECYSAVARNSGEKEYCAEIIADPTRDACLIDFAFNKDDYTVCDDIANPFVQQSCEQLEQVAALQV